MRVRLDIGCGTKVKEGYIGVDCVDLPNVNCVCNAWDIGDYYTANSVDAIHCRHSFEHYTFQQGVCALTAWHKILKTGGELNIIVPNIDYHMQQILAHDTWNDISNWGFNDITNIEHALGGLYGWQVEGVFDVHKSGYNYALLKQKLYEAKFVNVEKLPSPPWDVNIVCKKV